MQLLLSPPSECFYITRDILPRVLGSFDSFREIIVMANMTIPIVHLINRLRNDEHTSPSG